MGTGVGTPLSLGQGGKRGGCGEKVMPSKNRPSLREGGAGVKKGSRILTNFQRREKSDWWQG